MTTQRFWCNQLAFIDPTLAQAYSIHAISHLQALNQGRTRSLHSPK